MRIPILVSGFLLVALSGCSDAGAEGTDAADAEAAPDAGGARGAVDAGDVAAPAEPVLEDVAVLFDGNLGTWFYACEYETTGVCQGMDVVADSTDHYHEQPGATLVGAALRLEWTATTPATDTLGLGLMRMGDNSTLVENVEGTSPLTLEADGLDLALEDGDRLHLYVYNVRGFAHEPPVVGYATADQAFTVEGTLTMRTG